MNSNQDQLLFPIDIDDLKAVQVVLGATESQMAASYNRAISRTAQTLKSLTNKLVRDEIGVKNLKSIQKRFQQFRLRSTSKQKSFDELVLWFGLNDISVGYLKGTTKRIGTKKQPKGAVFTPKGKISSVTYKEGFVAHRYQRRSIFTRVEKGRFPIREARVGISERLQVSIEDDIFSMLPDIFLKHYQTDLKGRVAVGLNKKNWQE